MSSADASSADGCLLLLLLLAGRKAATDDELEAVPDEWLDLAPYPLRDMQARAFVAMAGGGDLVVNAATGSGKGLLLALPAAAAWHAAEPGVLALVDVVIVPYKALGIHLEKTFNALFEKLAKEGKMRKGARALFVHRSQHADSAEEPEPEEPKAMQAESAARDAPLCLPCGVCDMCTQPRGFKDQARQRAGGCIWTCRVAMPDSHDEWCTGCWKDRDRAPQVVGRCKLRSDILDADAGGSAATPQTGGLSRTRSVLAVAAAAAATNGAEAEAGSMDTGTTEGAPNMRLTFDDLDKDKAPEHAILSDAAVAIVLVTANAVASPSQRGRLLRDAVVARGVRRDHFDELDQIHDHGMAGYNSQIVAVGRMRNVLATRLAARGLPRPQRLGYTATLAPSCQTEVLRRAGFAGDTTVVRASIDRPELTYARVPIASIDGETLAQLVARSVLLVHEHAPTWAVGGRIVVNCTLTTNCLRVAALLRAHGFSAHAYTTNNMTDVGRALALAAFAANPKGILVPTEAWGQGVSVPGIHLIINAGLKSNPVTAAQHDGRAARESDERGLAVTILNGRLTAERLRLADPSKRGAFVGPTLLLSQLCARGCMRERSLRYLGGCVDRVCAGCDDCSRRGAASALLQPIGRLHDLSRWVEATAAAVHLLAWLCERDDEPMSLSVLQSTPPPDAPPPFHALPAHDRLVDSLMAHRGLRAEGRPVRHGRGGLVLVTVDMHVKQLLEFGGESLYVLISGECDDDDETLGGDCQMGEAMGGSGVEPAASRRRRRRCDGGCCRRGRRGGGGRTAGGGARAALSRAVCDGHGWSAGLPRTDARAA